MTKYILVGGYPKKAKDGGRALVKEMIKGFKEPVKILICHFARPEANWESNFKDDEVFFNKFSGGKKINFKLAQVKEFSKQTKWADVIYLRGGETNKLIKLLSKDKSWTDLLDGKTLTGSSAGAYAMGKYSYELDLVKPEKRGMNLLDVKVLVHYMSDFNAPKINWPKALKDLKDFGEKLPVVVLREGEFKVIKQ